MELQPGQISRRRDSHSAPPHPPASIRRFNSDGERERQQNDSLANGYHHLGEIVLLSTLLLHSSGLNRSGQSRRALSVLAAAHPTRRPLSLQPPGWIRPQGWHLPRRCVRRCAYSTARRAGRRVLGPAESLGRTSRHRCCSGGLLTTVCLCLPPFIPRTRVSPMVACCQAHG